MSSKRSGRSFSAFTEADQFEDGFVVFKTVGQMLRVGFVSICSERPLRKSLSESSFSGNARFLRLFLLSRTSLIEFAVLKIRALSKI